MPETGESMGRWVEGVRGRLASASPELLPLFETYAAEALFGRRFIAPDLGALAPGAHVLEVGAGSLLLSCQLVREGFRVTSIEPVATGFSHFSLLQQAVLRQAQEEGCVPRVIGVDAENFDDPQRFSYAFSINVMEHVLDVERVIERVSGHLQPGAAYHFTCPNYLFPYEPHFNIPTLFSKRLTLRVLRGRILESRKMPDPRGMWESLNWINVPQLRAIVRRMPSLRLDFNPNLLVSTFGRVATDPDFAGRRSPAMRRLILLMVHLRLHTLLRFIPVMIQPIIDCRLTRQPPGSA